MPARTKGFSGSRGLMVVSANSAGHVQPRPGDAYGQFVFSGDVPIGRVANFYGFPVPRAERAKPLTDFIRDHLHGRSRVGAQVRIEEIELVVQDIEGTRITRVGLELDPPAH
jgi:NhaP-type Na+/H+ and K+/H+ antiporter